MVPTGSYGAHRGGANQRINAVPFSPDGSLLAVHQLCSVFAQTSTAWTELLVLDAATGELRSRHRSQVIMRGGSLAFSPDGRILVSADQAGVLSWGLAAGGRGAAGRAAGSGR